MSLGEGIVVSPRWFTLRCRMVQWASRAGKKTLGRTNSEHRPAKREFAFGYLVGSSGKQGKMPAITELRAGFMRSAACTPASLPLGWLSPFGFDNSVNNHFDAHLQVAVFACEGWLVDAGRVPKTGMILQLNFPHPAIASSIGICSTVICILWWHYYWHTLTQAEPMVYCSRHAPSKVLPVETSPSCRDFLSRSYKTGFNSQRVRAAPPIGLSQHAAGKRDGMDAGMCSNSLSSRVVLAIEF